MPPIFLPFFALSRRVAPEISLRSELEKSLRMRAQPSMGGPSYLFHAGRPGPRPGTRGTAPIPTGSVPISFGVSADSFPISVSSYPFMSLSDLYLNLATTHIRDRGSNSPWMRVLEAHRALLSTCAGVAV